MSGLPTWSDGCTGGLPSSVLSQLVVRPGTCYAQGDVLIDSSTGESIAFVRGPGTSEAVQIEHVVSLSDARHKPPRFRQRSANLLAVDAKANCGKAFRDANAWLRRRLRSSHLPALGFGEREARDGSVLDRC